MPLSWRTPPPALMMPPLPIGAETVRSVTKAVSAMLKVRLPPWRSMVPPVNCDAAEAGATTRPPADEGGGPVVGVDAVEREAAAAGFDDAAVADGGGDGEVRDEGGVGDVEGAVAALEIDGPASELRRGGGGRENGDIA